MDLPPNSPVNQAQIIENWVIINALVLDLPISDPSLPGYVKFKVSILKILPFENYPDLLSRRNVNEIVVYIRKEELIAIKPKTKIACKIKVTPIRYFGMDMKVLK